MQALLVWRPNAENKPSAAGNLGVDLAAKSPVDGYALVVVPAGNIAVNPTLLVAPAQRAAIRACFPPADGPPSAANPYTL